MRLFERAPIVGAARYSPVSIACSTKLNRSMRSENMEISYSKRYLFAAEIVGTPAPRRMMGAGCQAQVG